MDMWQVFLFGEGHNKVPLPASVDMTGAPILPQKGNVLSFQGKTFHVEEVSWDFDLFEIVIVVHECG